MAFNALYHISRDAFIDWAGILGFNTQLLYFYTPLGYVAILRYFEEIPGGLDNFTFNVGKLDGPPKK